MKYQDPSNPTSSSEHDGADGDLHPGAEAASRSPTRTPSCWRCSARCSAGALVGRTGLLHRRPTATTKTGVVTAVQSRHATNTEATAIIGGVDASTSAASPRSASTDRRLTRPLPRLTPPRAPDPRSLPMLRSMFSAISGLQAHQTKMDVIGNNIANVNTVGFKGSTDRLPGHAVARCSAQRLGADGRPRRHQPGAGRSRRQGRGDHHQLQPGRDPDHRPRHRLHDQRRRLLRDPGGQPAALHPRRVVRLRRHGQAGHPGRQRSCRAGWPTPTATVNTNGPIERPVGALRPDARAGRRRPAAWSRATCPPSARAAGDDRSRPASPCTTR